MGVIGDWGQSIVQYCQWNSYGTTSSIQYSTTQNQNYTDPQWSYRPDD